MRCLNVRLGRAGSWQQGSQMGCQGVGAGEEGGQALGLISILRPSGTSQPGVSGAEGEALPSPHSCCSWQVCCPPPPPHMTWGQCPIYTKKTKTQPSTCFFNRWLPESARWLIMVGKTDRALQELKKVAKINGHKEAKKTLTIEVRCYL